MLLGLVEVIKGGGEVVADGEDMEALPLGEGAESEIADAFNVAAIHPEPQRDSLVPQFGRHRGARRLTVPQQPVNHPGKVFDE